MAPGKGGKEKAVSIRGSNRLGERSGKDFGHVRIVFGKKDGVCHAPVYPDGHGNRADDAVFRILHPEGMRTTGPTAESLRSG
jgi:hypothetical protein